MFLDVGQDENRGDLTVRHWCQCGYSEQGPTTPQVAAKTSDTVGRVLTPLRELLRRQRMEGAVIPLKRDADVEP